MGQVEIDRHKNVPWQQGRLLMTRQTLRWTEAEKAEGQRLEERGVFAHFTASDEGRSRVRLMTCATAKEAAAVVKFHNQTLKKELANAKKS